MIVKICGIRSSEEALAAVEAGADLLGFNFYPPSPRYVTPEACAGILEAAAPQRGSFLAVGIFVNAKPAWVRAVCEECGLDLAQLSGDEPAADLAALEGRAFKAVRPRTLAEAKTLLAQYRRTHAPTLLVDAPVIGGYGGGGQPGDWTLARSLAARAPILLAGGLNPTNVGAAVRAVNPWGVDVASGVEARPGVKDPARIAAFVAAARQSTTEWPKFCR